MYRYRGTVNDGEKIPAEPRTAVVKVTAPVSGPWSEGKRICARLLLAQGGTLAEGRPNRGFVEHSGFARMGTTTRPGTTPHPANR
jgi:hypothetical protein